MKAKDVQYMKFDEKGNLYLYEPGSGMSGIPRRVIAFGSDEVIYAENCLESSNSNNLDKFNSVPSCAVHCLVPSKGASVTNFVDGKSRFSIFIVIALLNYHVGNVTRCLIIFLFLG